MSLKISIKYTNSNITLPYINLFTLTKFEYSMTFGTVLIHRSRILKNYVRPSFRKLYMKFSKLQSQNDPSFIPYIFMFFYFLNIESKGCIGVFSFRSSKKTVSLIYPKLVLFRNFSQRSVEIQFYCVQIRRWLHTRGVKNTYLYTFLLLRVVKLLSF